MHYTHIKLWIIGKTRCGAYENFSECKSKTVLKNKYVKSIKKKKPRNPYQDLFCYNCSYLLCSTEKSITNCIKENRKPIVNSIEYAT